MRIRQENAKYNSNGMIRRFLSLLAGIIIALADQYSHTAKIAFSQNNKPSISDSGAQLILRGKTPLDAEKDDFMSFQRSVDCWLGESALSS